MQARRKSHRFPWIIATLTAVTIVGGGAFLVKLPQSDMLPAPVGIKPVELTSLTSASGQEYSGGNTPLQDPVPLYLPTQLNSGQASALSDEGRREPVAAFSSYTPKLLFDEAGPKIGFPSPVQVPVNVVDAYNADQGPRAFRYLGLRSSEVGRASSRLGYLEVAHAGNGELVYRSELPVVEGAPTVDWAPLQLITAVNSAGLIGSPFVIVGSGVAAFDSWIVDYLASRYRLGERLRPGIYRISLGP